MGFLNEREAYIIKNHLNLSETNITFYGGYDNASRTVLCSSIDDIDNDDFPIKPVYFIFRSCDVLSHRDFLGALINLGIERSCIGDIIVNNGCAVVFVKSDVYNYVVSQVSKIGRIGVKIVNSKPNNLAIKQDFEDLQLLVSSMRLDVIVASLTNLSRQRTSEMILSGKVFCNYLQTQNVSHKVIDNDIVSIRGYGKYIVEGQIGLSKKGRIKLSIKHFS
ncbi:MAG: YlmH/Sll1252 family protein [Ruminococcus sp.]